MNLFDIGTLIKKVSTITVVLCLLSVCSMKPTKRIYANTFSKNTIESFNNDGMKSNLDTYLKKLALNAVEEDYTEDIVTEVFLQSKKTGLPIYVIYTLIHTESDFKTKAVSRLGVNSGIGLMQVSYFALKEYNEKYLGIYNPKKWKIKQESLYNIKDNLEVGCWYYNRILKVYLSSSSSYQDAYIAYNVGPTLFKAQKNNLYKGFYIDKKGKHIKYRLPPIRYLSFETKYVEYFYGS